MSQQARGSAEAFMDLLIAAMRDAALNKKLTQLQTQLDPDGSGRLRVVRIVVIPEEMDRTWPSSAPLGSAGQG
jgi:hypothetical protein